jgi:Domain of unknown function (DUF397)
MIDDPGLTYARWRKSVRSAANEACVEVAPVASGTAVRDAKNPHGPALLFAAGEWSKFARAVKTGGFDLV